MMGMGFGFGLVFMVLFWLMIIALAVWLLGKLFPRISDPSMTFQREGPEKPIEILKRRYVQGEISGPEYEEMAKVIQADQR